MCSNFTLKSIKAALELKVAESKLAKNDVMALHLMAVPELPEEETAAEKTKRIGLPTYNLEALMKEVGCEEQIPKLEENRIDQGVFWSLEDGDFKDVVEVKSFGKRKTLMNRIKEIKAEHEKEMEEKHK